MPVVAQEAMVKAAKDAGAEFTTERLDCGHSPFLVKPRETAEFLMRAAANAT